ncbi:MAG: DsbC family protein [Pedobacter sp.]|nr:DsbC family protein [Pedobacter sp.]
MKLRLLSGLALLAALAASVACAGPEDVIRAKVKAVVPDIEIKTIKPSVVPGLYEVKAKNYETVMVSADGRYLVQGEVMEIKGKALVSVEDQSMAAERKAGLATVARSDMIIYPAVGKAKSTIYVFTDVECGYCRKFHQEVPKLNKLGVEVRYLAFPRKGPNTDDSAKMDSVWCAKDRLSALTQAKNGVVLPAAPSICKSPVATEYEFGQNLGVRGTPAIFDVNGMQLGGYVPADQLAKDLGIR